MIIGTKNDFPTYEFIQNMFGFCCCVLRFSMLRVFTGENIQRCRNFPTDSPRYTCRCVLGRYTECIYRATKPNSI